MMNALCKMSIWATSIILFCLCYDRWEEGWLWQFLSILFSHTFSQHRMYKIGYRCRFLESLAWTKFDLTGGRFANSRTPTQIQTIKTHTQERERGKVRELQEILIEYFIKCVSYQRWKPTAWCTWPKQSQKQLDGIEQWNLITSQLHLTCSCERITAKKHFHPVTHFPL